MAPRDRSGRRRLSFRLSARARDNEVNGVGIGGIGSGGGGGGGGGDERERSDAIGFTVISSRHIDESQFALFPVPSINELYTFRDPSQYRYVQNSVFLSVSRSFKKLRDYFVLPFLLHGGLEERFQADFTAHNERMQSRGNVVLIALCLLLAVHVSFAIVLMSDVDDNMTTAVRHTWFLMSAAAAAGVCVWLAPRLRRACASDDSVESTQVSYDECSLVFLSVRCSVFISSSTNLASPSFHVASVFCLQERSRRLSVRFRLTFDAQRLFAGVATLQLLCVGAALFRLNEVAEFEEYAYSHFLRLLVLTTFLAASALFGGLHFEYLTRMHMGESFSAFAIHSLPNS
jgi:hypothetical protein